MAPENGNTGHGPRLEARTKIRTVWSKLNQAPGRHLCSGIQDREYRAGTGALTQQPKAGKHQIEERRARLQLLGLTSGKIVSVLAWTEQKPSGAVISEPRPENSGGGGKARPTGAHTDWRPQNETRTA
jgi:hypothetical protein